MLIEYEDTKNTPHDLKEARKLQYVPNVIQQNLPSKYYMEFQGYALFPRYKDFRYLALTYRADTNHFE